MAFGKSLELAKIKPTKSFLGEYSQSDRGWFRAFGHGSILVSKDGVSKYMVSRDGSFRKII